MDLLGGDRVYFKDLSKDADTEHADGPTGPDDHTPDAEVHAGVDEVITAFSGTFNKEDHLVESQMACLLEKRAKQPQANRRQRLSELAARHSTPGRGWTMKIARQGL